MVNAHDLIDKLINEKNVQKYKKGGKVPKRKDTHPPVPGWKSVFGTEKMSNKELISEEKELKRNINITEKAIPKADFHGKIARKSQLKWYSDQKNEVQDELYKRGAVTTKKGKTEIANK